MKLVIYITLLDGIVSVHDGDRLEVQDSLLFVVNTLNESDGSLNYMMLVDDTAWLVSITNR